MACGTTIPGWCAVVAEFDVGDGVRAGFGYGGVFGRAVHDGLVFFPAEVADVLAADFHFDFFGGVEIFEVPSGLMLGFWAGRRWLWLLVALACAEVEVVVFCWIRLYEFTLWAAVGVGVLGVEEAGRLIILASTSFWCNITGSHVFLLR